MKHTALFTSATTAIALTLSQSVMAAEIIDSPNYARNLGNYIVGECNEGINQPCLSATMNAIYSVASDLSEHIKEVTTSSMPFESGMAQGDLLANCETPMNRVTNQEYSNLQNFQAAALNAVESCIDSIRRSEGAVGIEFQPTSVNTIANHVNCIRGKECITESYAPSSF